MKVAVIGAGIVGLTTAYALAKEGYEVTVIDQEAYPAMRTSYANGGQVSVSNSEVWNTWGNVRKGIKWMFKKDAPLLIRLSPSWSKIKWLVKFLYHTVHNDYEKNTAETIKMGLRARTLYQQIIQKERLEFNQSACGILHFYKDGEYFENAINAQPIYTQNGCQWDIVTHGKMCELEPTLSNLPEIIGGVWTQDDWTGDIHKFCIQLSKVLTKKYKVNFLYNTKIDTVKHIQNYDLVIVCSGVGSIKIAKSIGDSLPIYPVKGYSITIDLDEESTKYAPTVSLLDDQAKIVTARLGTQLRIAGTAELDGENYDIRKDRIEPLLNWVHQNFPKINTSNYRSWACLRPMTPNMMPIVKQSKSDKRIYYNTGHGHLGWTLAPATAEQLVNLIKNT